MQVVSEAKDNFRKDDDVSWQFGAAPIPPASQSTQRESGRLHRHRLFAGCRLYDSEACS